MNKDNDYLVELRLMKESGQDAEAIYKKMMIDGKGMIDRIRLIRDLFSLDLIQAKDLDARIALGEKSLESSQEKIVDPLTKALEQLEEEK